MIDIANATIADVFAHLLEVQGHAGLDPNKTNEYGYSVFPNASCGAWKGGGYYRELCPACIALRKYRLDQGETEKQIEQRFQEMRG